MVKSNPEPAATRGERTRAAIIEAARARFVAEGYDHATGARIAGDAGVSEPSIAFHFGNKAGLLIAVMEAYYDELLVDMEAVIDPVHPPRERLADIAEWWLSRTDTHWRLTEVFARQGRRSTADEVTEAFAACNRRVTREFDRLVEDLKHAGEVRTDVPTWMVRDVFFGTCEHLVLGRVLVGRQTDLSAAARHVVDLLLHGVGVPRPTAATDPVVLAKLDEILARLPTTA